LIFGEAFTKSARAYKKYIEGTQFFMSGDYNRAIETLQEAYTIDSAFTLAAFYIANANNIMTGTSPDPKYADQAILWTQKAFEGKERLPEEYQHWVEMWRAYYITKNSNEVLDYCSLLEKSEIKSRYYWYDVAITYSSNFEMWDKAADNFRKIEMISSEWGEDWKFREYYKDYGDACHQLGKHEEEALLFETGLRLFPDDIYLLYGQALCATSTGNTTGAAELIKKLIEIVKQQGASESEIEVGLGNLYEKANSADLAEQHFRRALLLDSHNADRMNTLATFLINNDRDIIEGMTLVDNALKIYPKAAFFLWTKGNGYYKQGKYKEALDFLQQAKDNFISIIPKIERDIQKVKDAINNQK
jgi:tetratricopeptide (TPR) repeat protein